MSACKYRHARRSPARSAVHVHDLVAGQTIVRKARQKACDGDTQLEARQSRAEAIVHAVPECHVAIGAARDVDAVRVLELLRVAIGGADHDMDDLASTDLPAPDLKIFTGR